MTRGPRPGARQGPRRHPPRKRKAQVLAHAIPVQLPFVLPGYCIRGCGCRVSRASADGICDECRWPVRSRQPRREAVA